ncbi:MAG: hypothetical protein QOF70_3637 [Acetobacteraceae bacterium]|jgi:hypothetical protein|nr:hypothetical protein [Acetobacteraceae bacterium]
MMRRSFWFIVVAIPLLLAAGEAAYWRISAERLRTGYQAWVAAQDSRGWDVGSGPISIGGWPGEAAITVPNLTLRHAGPTVPGDVNVASAGVRLAVSLFSPSSLHLSLMGPMHVRAGELPDVIVTGDETSASVPLRQTGPLSVELHGRGLRLEAATGAWHVTVGLLNAKAEIAADAPADQSQPAATFVLSSEAIALPAGVKWPLGSNISSLVVEGRVNGALPNSGDITRWAEAWRDGGGSLEITHLTMGWGPLGLTSSATLALDDQLQPMGSGNGRIVGYAETLDRLAAAGMLSKSAATAAKAVLSLMAGTSDNDEPSSVDVPLTLQYRTLSIRQIPLVRLPEVDWPAR